MDLSQAAANLKAAYLKYHFDGPLFYDAVNLTKFNGSYFVRNYQVSGETERASLGNPYRERQFISSDWEVWTQAAAGDEKHFKLTSDINLFIQTKRISGLYKITQTQLLRTKEISAADQSWVFSLIRQEYYFDNIRRAG